MIGATLLLLGSFALALASEPAQPTPSPYKTYFVSPLGSDTNSGLDRRNPFQTLEKALMYIDHGDTVKLMEGEYNGKSNCGVVITKDVILTSEDGDPVRNILNCLGVESHGIKVSGSPPPRVKIHGISIESSGDTPVVVDDGSQVEVSKMIISDNTGTLGGAVRVGKDAYLMVTNCEIEDNQAEQGGAIYADGPKAIMIRSNTRILNNKAGGNGGAVWMQGGLLQFEAGNWLLSKNSAIGGDGGALYLHDVSLNLGNGPMQDNFAKGNGGAIFAVGTTDITVTQVQFTNNHALNFGGALCMRAGTLIATQTSFRYNSAKVGGGVALTEGCSLESRGNNYFFNTAKEAGGGLFLHGCKSTDHQDEAETFESNIATVGGGVYVEGSTCISFKTELSNNTATGAGGALYIKDSQMSMRYCNIQRNVGGGIYCDKTRLILDSSELSFNYKQTNLYCEDCNFRCRNCRACDCDNCDDPVLN